MNSSPKWRRGVRIAAHFMLVGLVASVPAAQARNAFETFSAGASETAFPVQLRAEVPFDPTAFPSGKKVYLMYELYLTNFSTDPLTLTRVDVVDPATAAPVATFADHQLASILKRFDSGARSADAGGYTIAPGATVALFMSVELPRGTHVPDKLIHQIVLAGGSLRGAAISSHRTSLHVLASPVQGKQWLAADGPNNAEDNHHRRGIFIRDGDLRNSRRFAVDWKQVKNDLPFNGDVHNYKDYYSYGQPVFAVANAKVVEARDGAPDNPPGHNENFHPAVPVTIANAGGNTITLDLGGGQFAHYYHLQPGSVAVKAGDHVRRGQRIARIGASGDAREPHLHIEITTDAGFLTGEGVPYVIDHYRVTNGENGAGGERERELPMGGMMIDFEPVGRNAK